VQTVATLYLVLLHLLAEVAVEHIKALALMVALAVALDKLELLLVVQVQRGKVLQVVQQQIIIMLVAAVAVLHLQVSP
jgi:hypothetical protein